MREPIYLKLLDIVNVARFFSNFVFQKIIE